jgi:hypothetical protein
MNERAGGIGASAIVQPAGSAAARSARETQWMASASGYQSFARKTAGS